MELLFIFIQDLLPDISETSSIWKVVTYLITGVIGGVLYKYVSLLLGYKNNTANRTQELSEKLLLNLSKRVQELEAQREGSHKRELEITKQLAASQTEVQGLRKDVSAMQKTIIDLRNTVEKYVSIYGPLSNE
jgi:chromosome segregation ATPase